MALHPVRGRCHAELIIALSAVATSRMPAQTQDEARLIIGISAGRIGAVGLYDIPSQPIESPTNGPSAFHLNREFRANITMSGHLTYFRGPHLGVSLEFTYLGLGTRDRCTVTQDGGDVELLRACAALDGKIRSPATSEIQGGFMLRPLSQSPLQPYVKAQGGLAFTPNSTTYTVSEYPGINGEPLLTTVFPDDTTPSIRPSWTAAFGISTAPHTGYQFRVEVRESWMRLNEITGPTSYQGLAPPIKAVIKGFPSIVFGFDVVLAKRRGRRY
jgi:hypothetical protein